MFAGMTIYNLLWFFFLYSVLGWIVEVIYHVVACGKIVNRGFLNGPVCPIYGVGMIGVLWMVFLITPEGQDHPGLVSLFLGGMLLTTAIELFGGWALDKLFHMQWWDYSDLPFNFHGYICLKFSILWGIGVVLVVTVLHPIVSLWPFILFESPVSWIILACVYVIFAADLVITVLTVRGLAKDLAEIERLGKALHSVSDNMTVQIGEGTLKAQERIESQQVQAALAKAEMRDRMETARADAEKRRAEMQAQLAIVQSRAASGKLFGKGRLLTAFPDLRSRQHERLMEDLKKFLRTREWPERD